MREGSSTRGEAGNAVRGEPVAGRDRAVAGAPSTPPAASRLALITGASAGMGAAAAAELLRRGWEVIGVARRTASVTHARYRHLALDLGDLDRLTSTMEAEVAPALRRPGWNRVALVNNAADSGPLGPLEDADAAAMARVMTVNVAAPLWLMAFVVRAAADAGSTRLVNVTSGAGSHAFPGLGPYSASKAALEHGARVFAAELDSPERRAPAPRDTKIVIYDPGPVDTAMQSDARSRAPESFPWVGIFHVFLARGMLATPAAVGADLADTIESDPAERYTVRRFGA